MIRAYGGDGPMPPTADLNAPIEMESQRGRPMDESQSDASFIPENEHSFVGDRLDSVVSNESFQTAVIQDIDIPDLDNLDSDDGSEKDD